jgi:hypothetical protein
MPKITAVQAEGGDGQIRMKGDKLRRGRMGE